MNAHTPRHLLKRLPALVLAAVAIAAIALMTAGGGGTPAGAQTKKIAVDPFIWQFTRDYPGANQNDAALPISRILIKTHDGTHWMSTFDDHPLAISGPQALKQAVDMYKAQGIETVAWFVPKGTDVEGQLKIAKQVIDTPGVKALYADVEPFAGFCLPNCAYLADTFWKRLRQDRPNATLGVIYDPREWWLETEAAPQWLKHADVALPMCYWESFYGQGPWADPRGCVTQGFYSMKQMVGNKPIAYEPALQGDSDSHGFVDRFKKAIDAALDLGSERVTVWRRGTVQAATWNAIAAYSGTIDRPCWIDMPNGCLLQEFGDPKVYLIEGGAKFHIPNPQALKDMGYTFADVDPAPSGFMATVPDVPRDDTLIREHKGNDIYVVYAGARFRVADAGIASPALAFNLELTRSVPPGGLGQVPTMPSDYTRFREESTQAQYLVVNGGRVHISKAQLETLKANGYVERLYVLPDGGLAHIPIHNIPHGDVSCDGALGAIDALMMLQTLAGVPNPGVCSTPDIDCDGVGTALDALKLLQAISGLNTGLPDGCPVPVATE